MALMKRFSQLCRTAQTHFRLRLHAAIVHIAAHLVAGGGDETLEHFSFLQGYLNEVQTHLPQVASLATLRLDVEQAIDQWEAELHGDSRRWPLRRLVNSGLTAAELLAFLWSGLVELDARFSAVYGQLHPQPDEPRLTVGLLTDLLSTTDLFPEVNGWQVAHTLHQHGLVNIEHTERPRAARTLHVVEAVWDVCSGETVTLPAHFRAYAQDDFAPLNDLQPLLPPTVFARLQRAPHLLADRAIGGLILRGMRGSGRLQTLGSVARMLGLGVLVLVQPNLQQLSEQLRQLGPLAMLLGLLPVIELELGPGERMPLPQLPGHRGPVGVLLGLEGSIEGDAVEHCVTLQLPAPQAAGRRAQWAQTLGYGPSAPVNGQYAIIEEASTRLHLTYGAITRAGRLAQSYARLEGRAHVALHDIQEACRTLNQQSLDALATRLEAGGRWEQLIVSPTVQAELHNLVMRCRQREAVLTHLGTGFGHITRGVRALFGGPSGTGKTLAARILAAELGLDLYRVDLASVVSKYIGETERNLSRLFARAEEQDIILLLDEGDSLMTGRTEVRSSNDRYANMETNYLLQRLEHYEGIFLVTTNAANRIDGAFQRRMDVYIEFTAPTAAQRYAIWQLHLPTIHALSEKFMRTVATRCDLSGGQIRNAALHATVLAVEHAQLVSNAYLAEGVAREYRKRGAGSPLSEEAILL
jgi:hypothetical protein